MLFQSRIVRRTVMPSFRVPMRMSPKITPVYRSVSSMYRAVSSRWTRHTSSISWLEQTKEGLPVDRIRSSHPSTKHQLSSA